MVNELSIPGALLTLVRKLQANPADSSVGQLLRNCLPGGLDDQAASWLRDQERREAQTVVFVFETYGYVTIGSDSNVWPVVDPDLEGLRIANEIFQAGINAPAIFHSGCWGMTPNALRNALACAARWAERHHPPLALAIRSISVRAGRPLFEPARPMTVRVF